jgi:N,N-dimethylformamidase
LDGTYGGLWRRNGRPPQQLAGVGFTSQGEHRGGGYQRTAASYDADYQWIFEGIEDEVLGDFGLSGGGAAGFELDRADTRLGTPKNAVVLASAHGDSNHFVLVPEDILTNLLSWNGEDFEELIRSDIVYFETQNTGAVFSVGSITFCGSLPVNNGDNNISRLVKNVLNRFLEQ